MDGKIVQGDGLLALQVFLLIFQYLFMTDTVFFFLIVMCAIMGFTLFLFVMYHLYLISNGTTTNERVRKNDDIDYYSKQIKSVDKLLKQFSTGKTEIEHKGQKYTRDDIEAFLEACKKKKAIAERIVDKRGFFAKLETVYKS